MQGQEKEPAKPEGKKLSEDSTIIRLKIKYLIFCSIVIMRAHFVIFSKWVLHQEGMSVWFHGKWRGKEQEEKEKTDRRNGNLYIKEPREELT